MLQKAVRSVSPRKVTAEGFALVHQILDICGNTKGIDPVAFSLKGISDVADYAVIVSGRSDRHTQGIAQRLLECFEECGTEVLSEEGFDKGHWIVLDTSDVVVHIFYEPVRAHYELEKLWAKAEQFSPQPDARRELRLVSSSS